MAAVGEYPERVKNIFTNKELPTDGQLEITMWKSGRPVRFALDDKLPVRKRSFYGTDHYSMVNSKRSPNNAWWGPLLEKASAKYFGTYDLMYGGVTTEALYAFTGMPSMYFMKNGGWNASKYWKYISKWDKLGYIMTSGVQRSSYGLVGSHAYTVLGAAEYNGEKLILVRNPWGKEKYTGPWSDNDRKWTPAAQKALKHTPNKNMR